MNSEEKKEQLPTDTKQKEPVVDDIPTELEEAFRDAPKEVQRFMAMFRSGPMSPPMHPLFNKFTDAHIDKFLDYSQKDDENTYSLYKSGRWFSLSYVLIGAGFLIFLIAFLANNNKELLADIIKILVIFAGGIGGGFGLKSHLEKKKK